MLQVGWKYFPFKEITLEIENCSDALKGMRILQLSDLHLTKNVDIGYLNTLVKKINDLKLDLVVITGDIIQASVANITDQLSTFSKIIAPTYYVTGNHDIFYGPSALKTELYKHNVICLDNSVEIIHINGDTLQLVGISDRYSFVRGIKRPIKKLFSSLDKDMTTILLAHQPKDIKYTSGYKIDLQLSGHTHGGQIYPLNRIVKLFQPYFVGLYTYKKTKVYVTRGLGYWGVSIRYKSPSEIPVFTIN